jgi:hypothetical protein
MVAYAIGLSIFLAATPKAAAQDVAMDRSSAATPASNQENTKHTEHADEHE